MKKMLTIAVLSLMGVLFAAVAPAPMAAAQDDVFIADDDVDGEIEEVEVAAEGRTAIAGEAASLADLAETLTDRDAGNLAGALISLERAQGDSYWDGDVVADRGGRAFGQVNRAIRYLDRITTDDVAVQAVIDETIADLVAIMRDQAQDRIVAAIEAEGSERQIARAEGQMERGDNQANAGKSVLEYLNAWISAGRA